MPGGRPRSDDPRSFKVESMMTPDERDTIDQARGSTPRGTYLRLAALEKATAEPFTPEFLRGLRRRAPTGAEVELFELACFALDSGLPVVREESQKELESILRHILETAAQVAP